MTHLKTKLILGLLIILLSSCSVMQKVKGSGIAIPPGTEVPYSKITNQAFAEDYIGQDVIVKCRFLSAGSTANYAMKKPPKGHFAFMVMGDSNPSKNTLTDAEAGLVVFAPMQYSDKIFSLQQGDPLTLRGGNLITKLTMEALSGVRSRYIHFVATDIKF